MTRHLFSIIDFKSLEHGEASLKVDMNEKLMRMSCERESSLLGNALGTMNFLPIAFKRTVRPFKAVKAWEALALLHVQPWWFDIEE